MARAKKSGTRATRGRKSKAESMTGAKENAVETRQPKMDLKIASGEKIVHYLKSVKGYKEKLTTIQGQLRNVYKAAKAENVPKAVIDELLALERGDADAFRSEMEALAVGLKAVGALFQLNVFDTVYGSSVESAAAKGRRDGESGAFADNPYAEGTPEAEAYGEAYMTVQASRVPGMQNMQAQEDGASEASDHGDGEPWPDDAAVNGAEAEDDGLDIPASLDRRANREPAHA